LLFQKCVFGTDEQAKQTNKTINDSLIKDARKEENTQSLLLLGAGESGKSTILKQFKILHLNGFTHEEFDDFRRDIRINVLQTITGLCRAALSAPENVISPDLQVDVESFAKIHEYDTVLTPELGAKILRLWNDQSIRTAYRNHGDAQIQSNAEHLMESVERISDVDYHPSVEDILYCRVRTTGVVEIRFTIEDYRFRVVDVGGQRSERKKWVNFFDGITALLYVVALDEYDLTLFEDGTTNRMHESLRLFEEMCNQLVFAKTPTILFLNKKDLLKEKLEKVKLSDYFPEYKGESDYHAACSFIKDKYLALNRCEKKIYTHFTCATSTKNIKKVFDDVKHSVLMTNLAGAGVMM